MTHHITFISSDINKWPPQISGSKVYLFIDDYITYKKISDLVPDNWVNDSPKGELNLILNEIENELVNLDDLTFSGKFYFSRLASSFSESNPYRSDFLLNVCRIIFLIRKILVNSSALIVVEDLYFGEAVRQICSNIGSNTNWVGE